MVNLGSKLQDLRTEIAQFAKKNKQTTDEIANLRRQVDQTNVRDHKAKAAEFARTQVACHHILPDQQQALADLYAQLDYDDSTSATLNFANGVTRTGMLEALFGNLSSQAAQFARGQEEVSPERKQQLMAHTNHERRKNSKFNSI